jgi:hypothetical protein
VWGYPFSLWKLSENEKGTFMDLVVGGSPIQGCEPVEYLKARNRDFVVVDSNPNCPAVIKYGLKLSNEVREKGEQFLLGNIETALGLLEKYKPEYVFPSSPIHVVTEFAKVKFRLESWNEAIDPILAYLPPAVIFRAGKGRLAITFNRDKDCVEKCESEYQFSPSGTKGPCPLDRPKPCSIDKLMRFACPEGFILFSHTVSPGLGAFKGNDILKFLDWAEKKEKFVLATSCNCHGVFWGFKKTTR